MHSVNTLETGVEELLQRLQEVANTSMSLCTLNPGMFVSENIPARRDLTFFSFCGLASKIRSEIVAQVK